MTIVYNPSLNTIPTSQGILTIGAVKEQKIASISIPVQVNITERLVTNGVQINTNENDAKYAGFSNYTYDSATNSLVKVNGNSITFNQDTGYTILFDLSLDNTTSNSNDRAAFSLVVVSSNQKAIELGFESDSIFAQNTNFQRAESTPINAQNFNQYKLQVIGDNYSLSANNNEILTGNLRSYPFNPAISDPVLFFNPYTTSDLIFLGDNTGQEQGEFTLGKIEVSDDSNDSGNHGGNDEQNIDSLLNTPIYRFQNRNIPGTYVFVAEEERQNIKNNFPQFQEEGQAFQVAVQPDDDLIAMNRFQNINVPGTYLYAGVEESMNIRKNFSNFIDEGIAFYVYGAGSNQGDSFYRFQNSNIPGTYLFAGEVERQGIMREFPDFIDEGVAFKANI